MPSGNKTFTVPLLVGAWNQTSPSNLVVSSPTTCTLPTGVDVVALFSQSRDPKDHDVSEYNKLPHFLGKAVCQVSTWPQSAARKLGFLDEVDAVGNQIEYTQELARTSWLPPGEVRALREKYGIDNIIFDQIVRIVNRYAP